jgi:hypothetical protein
MYLTQPNVVSSAKYRLSSPKEKGGDGQVNKQPNRSPSFVLRLPIIQHQEKVVILKAGV